MKMEILGKKVLTGVRYVVTTIDTKLPVGVVVVKDVYHGDKIIDTQYLDSQGHEVDNPVDIEDIEEFLNIQEVEQNGWLRN